VRRISRISGEILGGLATLKEYGDYHLELEFKWGEKRFPPRADMPRDSGLLYHGVNGYNKRSGFWPRRLRRCIWQAQRRPTHGLSC